MHVGEIHIPKFPADDSDILQVDNDYDPAGAGINFCGMIVVFFLKFIWR